MRYPSNFVQLAQQTCLSFRNICPLYMPEADDSMYLIQRGIGWGCRVRRVYAREEVCIGCRLCEVHCLVQHSRSKDVLKAYKLETPRPSSRVHVQVEGPVSFALQCRHCAEPACMYACLTGALSRDSRGVVLHNLERCIGCWTCIMACPFGAIYPQVSDGRKVVLKCDLCPELPIPACVANCPNQALSIREDGA